MLTDSATTSKPTREQRQSELWIHAGQLDGELGQVDAIQGGQGAVGSIQKVPRLLLHHPFGVGTQLGLQHLQVFEMILTPVQLQSVACLRKEEAFLHHAADVGTCMSCIEIS